MNIFAKALLLLVLVVLIGGLLFLSRDETETVKSSSAAVGETTAPDNSTAKSGTNPESLSGEPVVDDQNLFANVVWRDRPESPYKDYPDTYDELRAMALDGDVLATRKLIGLLGLCQRALLPMSEEELQAIVDRMRATYSSPSLIDGRLVFLEETTGDLGVLYQSEEEFHEFVDRYHEVSKPCAAVSVEQRGEYDDWIAFLEAQTGGSVGAEAPPQDLGFNDSLEQHMESWASGDPYALALLSGMYGEDEALLADPEANIKKYAYSLALYHAVIESARYYGDFRGVAETQAQLKNIERYRDGELSAYEVERVKALAREIVESNANCCMRLRDTRF